MNYALVLSGGGARGLAHIGLIRELERRGYPKPAFVAGTSMGAIVGGLYAAGWSGERLEAYALAFDVRRYMESPAFRLPDFALGRLFQAGAAVGSLAGKRPLDSGSRVLSELERLFEGRSFADLTIPFACMATDLGSGEPVKLDSGSVAAAVRASMSVPGIFAPVQAGDAWLADGGVVSNLPCLAARARGYRRILACDVTPFGRAAPESFQPAIGAMQRAYDVAAHRAQEAEERLASLIVPVSEPFSALAFDRAAEIIELGRRAAKDAPLDAFFAPLASRIRSIFSKLSPWNDSAPR